MIKDVYLSSIEKDVSETVARFILTLEGDILKCNYYACILFRYASPKEVEGINFREMVPQEFAEQLPDKITIEHLTNGVYLDRVNICKDGTLINTLVFTKYVYLDSTCYVECRVMLNDAIPTTTQEHRYKQMTELLLCEVEALKNRSTLLRENYLNERLNKKLEYYSLTKKEVIFCSLFYSGMHTKEISSVINLTIESTYKLRKRLRKKLALAPQDDLKCFLEEMLRR